MEEQLQVLRARAIRFRAIAGMMWDPDTISALRAMAAQFEAEAEILQNRRLKHRWRH